MLFSLLKYLIAKREYFSLLLFALMYSTKTTFRVSALVLTLLSWVLALILLRFTVYRNSPRAQVHIDQNFDGSFQLAQELALWTPLPPPAPAP